MALFSSNADIARLQRQLAEQQALIDHLYLQLGLPKPTASRDEELATQAGRLKESGKEVQAIKIVREKTGMGLLEAKQYVDRL